ncbi:hypothetical protein [Kibdelosporangium phytohabitans]|uniref:Alkaline shock response membrane anchor protein AmaP n=1 Tax=Kibdelosporangium phytohabitans TaxID=860235 RepID=A0A0N9HV46_9PSEU|nr:hypothetical protein [Kibdelosporangium phytohabitans]ALG06043.1 hypothetical protein AOZ06_03130 [Kibdelosporangium phytohabitans]MBE1465880.1 hypothetical protein [Kibdelosporangium phytohabitans]
MSSLNRPARLNRSVLALCGLVLLAAGGFAVFAYFMRWSRPLVPGTALPPTWVLVVTAAAAVIIGLLCVGWLGAQLNRKPKTTTWRLTSPSRRGRTTLPGTVAVQPFADEVLGYPEVRSVDARVTGKPASPLLVLLIRVNQDAELAEVRRRINDDSLPRLRQALELPELAVRTEFRCTAKAGPRIR